MITSQERAQRIVKAQAISKSDGEFIARAYRDDPVGYVLDVIGAEPDAWQEGTLDAIVHNRRIAVASGHGVGKTALTAWIVLWFISTRPNPQIVVTANTKNQLDTKTWRELSKWLARSKNKHWFTVTATRMWLEGAPQTHFAAAIPWTEHNAEAFAGTHEEHVLVLMDEASAVAEIIWDVVEGAMTTAGARLVAFGNPTRNTGRFKECWGKLRHRWWTKQVDGRTAKMADKEQIAEWIEDHGIDSDFVKIRVKGEFPNSSSLQFIPQDIVDAAIDNAIDGNSKAPIVLGGDIARFGDDQSVICARQGRKVLALRKFRKIDTMEFAGHFSAAINEFNPTVSFLDLGAMGAGVVDRLRELGYKATGINFGASATDKQTYANKRAEMWGRLRDWLKEGGVSLPNDQELAQDLISPEYSYNSNQQIILEKKEDMRRRGLASPDCGDALALTFAETVGNFAAAPIQYKEMNYV